METWRFIDSGKCEGCYNMALDETIAREVCSGASPPTLRVYGWLAPAVTLGAFQDFSDIDEEFCRSAGIGIVRRPTGGRALLHGNEVTYSFSSGFAPPFSGRLRETYRAIAAALLTCFERLGVSCDMKERPERGSTLYGSPLCFRSVSYGEITAGGRKLVGSAQRRWSDGFLQQGSIPLPKSGAVERSVFRSPLPLEDMSGYGPAHPLQSIAEDALKDALLSAFASNFGVRLALEGPSLREQDLAARLESEKYRSPAWTRTGRRRVRS